MPSYFPGASSATRPFITTPYTADAGGTQIPAWPNQCLCREPDVGCWLVLDHWRERRTGPCHPIAVVRCRVHDCAFTLYPRGHVPYGYAAIASPGLFEAATDAAARRAWPRESPRSPAGQILPGADRWWSTQGRRIAVAAGLTGVAPDLPARLREGIAEALGVDLLDVLERSARISAAPGYAARGAAGVCSRPVGA